MAEIKLERRSPSAWRWLLPLLLLAVLLWWLLSRRDREPNAAPANGTAPADSTTSARPGPWPGVVAVASYPPGGAGTAGRSTGRYQDG